MFNKSLRKLVVEEKRISSLIRNDKRILIKYFKNMVFNISNEYNILFFVLI